MHRPAALLAVVLLATATASPAVLGAQESTTCPAPRSYAACAVRVEPTFWSGIQLRRGAEGTLVGKVKGFGGSNLATMLAGSDSAVAHARRFTTDQRHAAVWGIVTGVLLGAAAGVDLEERKVTDAGLALVAGAAVTGTVGLSYQLRAQRSMARAVWWYNRDLAGAP